MNNKFLERELKSNILKNEIFECQTCHDLDNIPMFLKENKLLTEVIIEFDSEKISNSRLLHAFPYKSYENSLIWEQFVAIQILKELRKEFNINDSYDLEEQEQIIYNGSKEKYLAYDKYIPTINDVKELVVMFNNPIRLHILIRWFSDKCLCDAMREYLINDLYFNTMIYSDRYFNTSESDYEEYKETETIEYNYIKFIKFEEGNNISQTKYKNISLCNNKQKVKKYEKV